MGHRLKAEAGVPTSNGPMARLGTLETAATRGAGVPFEEARLQPDDRPYTTLHPSEELRLPGKTERREAAPARLRLSVGGCSSRGAEVPRTMPALGLRWRRCASRSQARCDVARAGFLSAIRAMERCAGEGRIRGGRGEYRRGVPVKRITVRAGNASLVCFAEAVSWGIASSAERARYAPRREGLSEATGRSRRSAGYVVWMGTVPAKRSFASRDRDHQNERSQAQGHA